MWHNLTEDTIKLHRKYRKINSERKGDIKIMSEIVRHTETGRRERETDRKYIKKEKVQKKYDKAMKVPLYVIQLQWGSFCSMY